MTSTKEDNSPDHSDCDDWTLVSPPHSSSSSPEREKPLIAGSSPPSNESSPNSSLEHLSHDGLTEIDLRGSSFSPYLELRTTNVAPTNCEFVEQGFQPMDTTTEEEDECESTNDNDGGRSSQSELSDFVDLGKKESAHASLSISSDHISSQCTAKLVKQAIMNNDEDKLERETACLMLLKTKMDELSEAASSLQRERSTFRLPRLCQGSSTIWRVPMGQWILLHLFILTLHVLLNYILITSRQNNEHSHHQPQVRRSIDNLPKLFDNLMDDLGDSIPTSQQYVELQLLHSELSQCIKRQSPSSYKYYISEDRFKEHSTSKSSKSYKSHRGLVCYGQEARWRKRIERLKSNYDLDLRRLMQEAKKRVTNEILGFYHPSLKFRLILNQIEYLDFIENKNNKKQSEDLVKYLKAENLQLLRRLSHPNETGFQKLAINLELENSRLKRENEVLKENLGQKAGTTYIKQSLELEQYERENIVLKQFHHQVSQDISKSLKQFNLHTIDAATVLDDQESLNSQLMLTRGYLRRLREKISTMLIENEGLKEELKEVYLMSVTNKANLPAINNRAYSDRRNNNSNALMMDNCTRTLMEVKEENIRLESELERLRRSCSNGFSSELENCSGRHLNRTSSSPFPANQSQSSWKQLSAPETALDKHARDTLALRQHDDIIDELMTFLTKFNNKIESNQLTLFDNNHQDMHENIGLLDDDRLKNDLKIIPNYIREAIRSSKVQTSNCNQQPAEEIMQKVIHPELPSAPSLSPMHISSSKNVNSSADADQHIENNNTNSEQNVDPTPMVNVYPSPVRDSWFFRRAKQRKQLRNNKIKDSQTDWMMKRATLREKLRKATSYIDDQYMASEHLDSKKPDQLNRPKYCKHKNGKNNDKQRHKKKHNHKQRNSRKHYRDEL